MYNLKKIHLTYNLKNIIQSGLVAEKIIEHS